MKTCAEIISLTKERLRRAPTIYTVVVCHDEHGMSFTVHDVQRKTASRSLPTLRQPHKA